jgi:hypothetical protein
MRTAVIPVILLMIFAALYTTLVHGFDVKLIKKIKLSQETAILENPKAFCVTEDNLFIIPDYKAGDVKIYENNGTPVAVLGCKGVGPGEFVKPAICCYDKNEGKFGVMDYGLRKIFIYERMEKNHLKRVNEIFCLSLGYAIQLKGNKMLISGYKVDPANNPYDLYYIDLSNNQTIFLLPSYYKYGLKSFREYETQYRRKSDFQTIGILGFCDIQRDDVFFVWEGDLRIIKINLNSGKKIFFGEKKSHYIKPFTSKQLLEGYRNRNSDIIRSEKARMSYITNIFAGSNYVLLFYEGPVKQDRESNLMLQFYTLAGEFIKEISIPGKPDSRMYIDKDRELLYSLSSEVDVSFNEGYYISEYKIVK